jgi:hypothetical protein
MGAEIQCQAQYGSQKSEGKALLETSEILFRGAGFRLKIPFSSIQSMKATNGELRVQTSDGLAIFHIGPAAEKWRDKILHPKSRIEKLGVKPDAKVSLVGAFEADFLEEIATLTKSIAKGKVAPDSDWIFFAVGSKSELSGLSKIARSMKGATGLWIVYPKGQKQITENDVLAAGRKSGLKDVKVVGFSPTHTALKFVIPVAKR